MEWAPWEVGGGRWEGANGPQKIPKNDKNCKKKNKNQSDTGNVNRCIYFPTARWSGRAPQAEPVGGSRRLGAPKTRITHSIMA